MVCRTSKGAESGVNFITANVRKIIKAVFMENIRQKIAEIITHTHKTPLEQADEILLLFNVVGRSEQLVCDGAYLELESAEG